MKILNYLIKRKNKKLHIPVVVGSSEPEEVFNAVLNTLRENKVMVKNEDGNVYIRMAGVENKGQFFSLKWMKVN